MEYPVAIVGAGPYGISLANHLHTQGTPFILFGKPMDLWRNHTFDSMTLRSDYATSEISHPRRKYSYENFCQYQGTNISDMKGQLPVRVFREYINWCFDQFRFAIEPQMIHGISKTQGGFSLQTESGSRLTAKRVVIASGIAHHLYVPDFGENHQAIIHSYHVQEIQKIKNRKVLVIGAGQSAAESIAVLKENDNEVDWYTKTDPKYFSEPLNIPKWLFDQIIRLPGIFRGIHPTIIQRTLGLFSATTITPNFQSLLQTVVHHQIQPSFRKYDIIISATGYHYDLQDIPFISEPVRSKIRQRQNYPILSRHFESSLRGLYFMGAIAEPFFGPSMKFMIGSRYSSAVVARALA